MIEDLVRAAVGFFAVVDPVGNVLVFQALAGSRPSHDRLRIALLAVATSLALVVLFATNGERVLAFLGIGMSLFQIAAGVLLVLPAIRLVERGVLLDLDDTHPADGLDTAVVPLAVPMLSGPGALALAVAYSADFGVGVTVGAAAGVLVVTFAIFAAAAYLTALVHDLVLRAAARLVGVLLMAIAIDFIVTGWTAIN
jgi:MarC family membrane protein